MIILEDVSIAVEGARIVEDLSFSIESNSMTLLISVNERALSRIIQAICGLIAPCTGRIEIDGVQVPSDALRKRMVCALEKTSMNPSLTPRQNLSYYLKLRGIERSVIDNLDMHARRLLLHEFLDRKTSELGQGLIRGFETLEALIVQPKYFIQSDFTGSFPASYFMKLPGELSMLLNGGSCIVSSTPSFRFARALSNHLPVRVVVLLEEGAAIEGPIEVVNDHFSRNDTLPPEPTFGEVRSVEIDRAINALPESQYLIRP